MAKYISGVNELSTDAFDGRTVQSAIDGLKTPLNIPDNCKVYVNGEETIDLSKTVHSNDEVEFVRETGKKG